jgi:peptide/nickel transport system permease protein
MTESRDPGGPTSSVEVGAGGGELTASDQFQRTAASIWSGTVFFARVLRQHQMFAAGYAIVFFVVLLSILAPWISPYSPITANPSDYFQSPRLSHPFGTDATGMDVFSRTIYAPRIDLTIAIGGTLVSAFFGVLIGSWTGYFQGTGGIRNVLSATVMRAADVLQAFPVFVFAIAVVAVLGQSIHAVILAIAFVNIPIYLRLMRGLVLTIRCMRYVEAAFVAGLGDLAIIRRHIIPNAIAPVLAQLSVNIGWSILLTAGLSFVGAGVRPPTPEWGSMIASGFQNVMTGQWWPSVLPGLALAVTVFGFALIGSSIEFLADPKSRRTVESGAVARDAEK